ncbi:hypothetical protein OSB04_022635 [Centaurea solstitialis]|uniref:Glutathione peroxidase n=1 Tax=Centaurea solstitialis TaxID=347529 RepID=A0AA38TEV6_9ASTR|nr:hypothetical protein OSB04_022635 [Centaurea solstitialis]
MKVFPTALAVVSGNAVFVSKIINVNGKEADPLYKFLKSSKGGFLGDSIKWNFTKFLVNSQGEVVNCYAPITSPLSIEGAFGTWNSTGQDGTKVPVPSLVQHGTEQKFSVPRLVRHGTGTGIGQDGTAWDKKWDGEERNGKMMVVEGGTCESRSIVFKGTCFVDNDCAIICKNEEGYKCCLKKLVFDDDDDGSF